MSHKKSLLTPRNRIAHLPINTWIFYIWRILEHYDCALKLSEIQPRHICLALNNASLIEAHKGLLVEANWLCDLQINFLTNYIRATRDYSSMHFILQPLVNKLRIKKYLNPNEAIGSFKDLFNAFSGVEVKSNTYFNSLAKRLNRSSEVLLFIHQVVVIEILSILLFQNDYRGILDFIKEHRGLTNESSILAFLDEAEVIVRFSVGDLDAEGCFHFLYIHPVVRLIHIATYSITSIEESSNGILTETAAKILDLKSQDKDFLSLFVNIISLLTNCASPTEVLKLIKRGLVQATELEDEVLRFQLLKFGYNLGAPFKDELISIVTNTGYLQIYNQAREANLPISSWNVYPAFRRFNNLLALVGSYNLDINKDLGELENL